MNDAIDTVIKRDESTETGPLLPPCVEGKLSFCFSLFNCFNGSSDPYVNCLEVSALYCLVFVNVVFFKWLAALNLGCIAVRASRSQRHSSVRTYLGPKLQEPVSASTNEPPYHHEYHQQAQQSSIKPSQTAQAAIPVDVLDNSNKCVATPRGYPFLHESMQMHQKPLAIRQGTSTAPAPTTALSPAPVNLGSVYPLYYGGNNQTQQADMPFRVPEAPIIIGMPIGIKPPEEATERVCDLSLRLGISSEPSTRIDIGSSRAYPGRNQEELCLFSEVKKNDRFDWFSNSEGQNSDSRVKKHKTLCGDFH